MSLREITLHDQLEGPQSLSKKVEAYVLVPQMLQQLQFPVGSLRQHWSAERLHNLLDGDRLGSQLIPSRASKVSHAVAPGDPKHVTYQTRPKAPMPTGCRSTYLDVISKVVPKI